MSRKGSGSGDATSSSVRQPAAWEPGMKQIWEDYLKSRSSGAREKLAEQYAGVLGGLMSQYLRPAYSIKVGGQTVPVIPRRNIDALNMASKALLQQYGYEVDPLQDYEDSAMKMQALRYGIPSTANAGSMSRTPSVLESIGIGTDLFQSIYPAVSGKTTTPTTASINSANPYSNYYNGAPLITNTGRVAAI